NGDVGTIHRQVLLSRHGGRNLEESAARRFLAAGAFAGTNRTGDLITSQLPVNRSSGEHRSPRPAKQPVRFANTLRCVNNRSRCTFLTLHSRNVWSAPKGTNTTCPESGPRDS